MPTESSDTDPTEPAPADMGDPDAGGTVGAAGDDDAGQTENDTDPMGINDEDPLDATLVGAPVDDQEDSGES
jgi:hypothetical protein